MLVIEATAFGIVITFLLTRGSCVGATGVTLLVVSSMFISCVQYCLSNSFFLILLKLDVPVELTALDTVTGGSF
uniref:Uncharacterized protein n=1 Tax=Panstrongylus lignarius TaxID=156445 RepID=A0A224XXC0_9HEMI